MSVVIVPNIAGGSEGDISAVTAGTGLSGGGASGAVTLNLSSPVALTNGGTGTSAASANAAFNALSPMTTGGDVIYGGASGAAARLANGTVGQVLTSGGTTVAPSWTTVGGSGANTALSNVASVAFSADLVFNTAANRIIATPDTSAGASKALTINTGDDGASGISGGLTLKSGLTHGSGGAGATGAVSLSSGRTDNDSGVNSGAVSIFSGISGNVSGAVNISTGDAHSGFGSGGINLTIGNGVESNSGTGSIVLTIPAKQGAGAQGHFKINDTSVGTAGHVWTSTDTVGTGHWAAAGGGGTPSSFIFSNTAIFSQPGLLIDQTVVGSNIPFNIGHTEITNDTDSAGTLNIFGGNTTSVTSPHDGGMVNLFGGSVSGSGAGGDVAIYGGEANTGSGGGVIIGGDSSSAAAKYTFVSANEAGTTSAAILIQGGPSDTLNGGDVEILAGGSYDGVNFGTGNIILKQTGGAISDSLESNYWDISDTPQKTTGDIRLIVEAGTSSTGNIQFQVAGVTPAAGKAWVATDANGSGTWSYAIATPNPATNIVSDAIPVSTGNVSGTAASSGLFTVITGSNSGTTDPSSTGPISIITGDETGATGDNHTSGNIQLATGEVISPGTSGSSGTILIGTGPGAYQTGDVQIYSGNGTLVDAAYSGGVALITGNVTGTATSGNVRLVTGSTGAGGTQGYISVEGPIQFLATNTAGGITGAQTINKSSGTVNFAAAASTLVVTNSLVTAASIILAVIRTDDSTATIKNVVPTAGSFTIKFTAAATAETSVGFLVINQ